MEWAQKEHLWLGRFFLSRGAEAGPLWDPVLTHRSTGAAPASRGEVRGARGAGGEGEGRRATLWRRRVFFSLE